MIWPTDSKYFIDIRKREEYENPTLSYNGVDPSCKTMTEEEETAYFESLEDETVW